MVLRDTVPNVFSGWHLITKGLGYREKPVGTGEPLRSLGWWIHSFRVTLNEGLQEERLILVHGLDRCHEKDARTGSGS